MILRYSEAHDLPVHPLRKEGAKTIGCIYCGGGAQFDNSAFRILRHTDPEAWRRMVNEYGFAAVILAIGCGLVLLAIIARTVLVVVADGRRRVRDRDAYDTRRPTL